MGVKSMSFVGKLGLVWFLFAQALLLCMAQTTVHYYTFIVSSS